MPHRVPQSVALRVPLKAYLSSDHVSDATGKTIAITISKNGAAFGNPSVGATNATEIANGWYYVDLSTTDLGSLGPLVIRGTAATIDNVEIVYQVVNANNGGYAALPDTTPGAAGGVFIAGSNAGTTVNSLTVTSDVTITGNTTFTGTTLHTGNVALNNGLTVTRSTANQPAVSLTGNGSGAGLLAIGGATGTGINATGVAGIRATGSGASNYGIEAIGTGATDSGGIKGSATTAGEGIEGVAAGNGHGMYLVGAGTGEGLHATGGSGNQGDGAHFEAGSSATNGHGMRITGVGVGLSHGLLVARGSVAGDDINLANSDAPTLADAIWAGTTRTLTSFGTLTTDTATAVWAAGTRTLTSFGTLVADVATAVWGAATRTLSAFGFSVTVGTNNDKTGYALTSGEEDTIVDKVWNEAIAGHLTAGSTGAALSAAGSAGDPWTTTLPGTYVAGQAGYIVGTNLDAAVSSRSTYAGGAVASVTGNVGGNVTGSVGSVVAPVTVGTNNDKTGYTLTSGDHTLIADAFLKRDMSAVTGESSRSPLNALRTLRNKVVTTNLTFTVYKEDDSTTAFSGSVTRDNTAEPITTIDPS